MAQIAVLDQGLSGRRHGYSFTVTAEARVGAMTDYCLGLNRKSLPTSIEIWSASTEFVQFILWTRRVTQDNLFVYTYEAPAALSLENAVAYENVHNITNEADLVASIPPETYGLKRCGVDYPIYDANVATLMKQFDENVEFPEFNAITDITDDPMDTDRKVLDFVLDSVFDKDEGASADVYANTREQYVDNYHPTSDVNYKSRLATAFLIHKL